MSGVDSDNRAGALATLRNKRILLGISGGIAAYKTPQLVRLLRQAEADVQVVLTPNAHHFVTATALQAVSGHTVRDTLWDQAAEAAMGHIELARWADLILIAPATADTISRLAHGRADDLLGALCLASRAPILLAPAMNQMMWQAPATRRNVATLHADGVTILGPDCGDQACGETGPGRMLEPGDLVEQLAGAAARATNTRASGLPHTGATGNLSGCRVIVTAGPTREPLDPVRYISNYSSGRQGYAIAEAARDAGAQVTLVSGPVELAPPFGMTVVDVTTGLEMHDACVRLARNCDLFVAVAAVADYRPQTTAPQKIKKPATDGTTGRMNLELVENPDIVATVAALPNRPVVIGFAAETHNTLEFARKKLQRKKLDAIVVNDVSQPDIGFASADNAAVFLWASGETQIPKQSKYDLARAVLQQAAALFAEQLAHTNPEDVAS